MDDFAKRVEAQIPRLRRYARALASHGVNADDLVQDCLVRALSKQHLWQNGTNLQAWLFTILHNQYVNTVRRSIREGTAIELSGDEPSLRRAAAQGMRLELRDLDRVLALLPDEQRTVILLIGLEGMAYKDAAKIVNIPVGTLRSRVSRGRQALRHLMGISEDKGAEAAVARPSANLAA
jgi:RNA polymerase sigma-70 factor (ECF subfamily)